MPSATTAEAQDAPIDVDSLKRLLQRFATERMQAPRGQVTAEFTELVECLLAQADQLGVDLLQGTEYETLRRRRGPG